MLPTIISREIQGFFPQEKSWMHLDWISLSGDFKYVTEFHDAYDARFNKLGLGWRRGRGSLAYADSLRMPERGLSLLWSDWNAPNNKGWGLLEISGKFFESHGLAGFHWLMTWLIPRKLRATRVDIANNLFHKGAIIEPLQRGLESGEYIVAGGRTAQSICSMKWQKKQVLPARTLYIGSRKSPTFSRIYDARAIHASEAQFPAGWHWTRYEMELKGDYANLLLQQIVKALDTAPVSMERAGIVLKAFAEGFFSRHQIQLKNSAGRSSRRSPCPEWRRLHDRSFRFRQRAARPEVSRERSVMWFQFGGAMKMLLAMEMAFGSDILDRLKHSFWSEKFKTDWKIWDKIKALAAEFQRPPILIGGSDCQIPLGVF